MGSLVVVADFEGPEGGNFIATQLRVASAVRDELGMDSCFVAPAAARGTLWTGDVEAAGHRMAYLDPEESVTRRARRLASLCRACDADLVHVHFTTFDVDAGIAGRLTGAKVLWHVHNGLVDTSWRRRAKDLVKVRGLGRLAHALVANSAQTERECLWRGFPSKKVHLVLNGIVLERLGEPAWERRTEARTSLGVPLDAFVVLAFGWDPVRKGVDLMLRAADAMHPHPYLLITGGDGLDRAVDAVLDAGRPAWLRTLPSFADVGLLYAAADVFLSASREDAFSWAIGEAMFCGLPVVSSDIPGPSHYYAAPGLRTFPSGDWRALATELESLVDADRQSLGVSNRAYAERYDIRHHVACMLDLYELLLDGSASTSPA